MKSFLFVLSGRNDSTAYTKFSYKIQNLTAFVYVFQKHFILSLSLSSYPLVIRFFVSSNTEMSQIHPCQRYPTTVYEITQVILKAFCELHYFSSPFIQQIIIKHLLSAGHFDRSWDHKK